MSEEHGAGHNAAPLFLMAKRPSSRGPFTIRANLPYTQYVESVWPLLCKEQREFGLRAARRRGGAEPGWGCGRSDARARPIVRVARISRNHAERSGTGGQRNFKEKKRDPVVGKLAESGSMILTAHSFLPSLAEIRLGWSRAVPRTRSVRHPGASHCARQFVLTVLAHALMTLFLTISDHISNSIILYE